MRVKEGIEMAEAVDPVLGRIGTFGKFQARVGLLYYISLVLIICSNCAHSTIHTHLGLNSIAQYGESPLEIVM